MEDALNSFGFLNFGHWNLFVIWDLLFEISANLTAPRIPLRAAQPQPFYTTKS
jgi:hypothetical protein